MELKNPNDLIQAQAMAKALRERKSETTIAEAQRIVNGVLAKRRQKADERRAFWDEYNEQLSLGNSNVNRGAHGKRHSSIRVWKPWA